MVFFVCFVGRVVNLISLNEGVAQSSPHPEIIFSRGVLFGFQDGGGSCVCPHFSNQNLSTAMYELVGIIALNIKDTQFSKFCILWCLFIICDC